MEKLLKYHLLVNPKSGHGKGLQISKKAKEQFKHAGIQTTIHVTEREGHAEQLANSLPFENYDAFCIIGGDGTMHEVINGMMNRADQAKLPIALIPAGTGNSLMHDLNCLDSEIAVKKILLGRLKKLDLIEIKTNGEILYGFNVLGWGVPVYINILADKLRWCKGQRYNLASLVEIFKNKIRPAKILIGKECIEGIFSFILACNTIYVGNGMKMAPKARIDDGLIDLLIVRKTRRIKLLSLFSKVFTGDHIHDPIVDYRKISRFSILSSDNQVLIIDGRIVGLSSLPDKSPPIHVTVVPGEIEIFA